MLETEASINRIKYKRNKFKVNHTEEKYRPHIPGGMFAFVQVF